MISFSEFTDLINKIPEWEEELTEYTDNLGPVDIVFSDGSEITANSK